MQIEPADFFDFPDGADDDDEEEEEEGDFVSSTVCCLCRSFCHRFVCSQDEFVESAEESEEEEDEDENE